MFAEGDRVLLIMKRRQDKRYLVRLRSGGEFHSHRGIVAHNDILSLSGEAGVVESSMGTTFYVLRPALEDLIVKVRRNTQILYPKDIGYILMRINAVPGKTIVEAGTGSGVLTASLYQSVMPGGRVVTWEKREEFVPVIIENLALFGIRPDSGKLDIGVRDVYEEGFGEVGADSIMLDLPEPWRCVTHLKDTLRPGGILVSLLPTTTQVSRLIDKLQVGFIDLRVEELLLREWKTEVKTLRPRDRMIAHTGFLVSCRRLSGEEGGE